MASSISTTEGVFSCAAGCSQDQPARRQKARAQYPFHIPQQLERTRTRLSDKKHMGIIKNINLYFLILDVIP